MERSVLSTGWSNVDTKARRADHRYRVGAATYTETNRRLATVRASILELAASANIEPPLTTSEVRQGTRNLELVEKIGESAIDLLIEHARASVDNRVAMAALRNANNRIAPDDPEASS